MPLRATMGGAGLQYRWDHHRLRGKRALVQLDIRDQVVLAVLYPVDDPVGGRVGARQRLPKTGAVVYEHESAWR